MTQSLLLPEKGPEERWADICAFLAHHEQAIKTGHGPDIPAVPWDSPILDRAEKRGLMWDLPPQGYSRVIRWVEIRKDGKIGRVGEGFPHGWDGSFGHPQCCFDIWFAGRGI